MTASDTTTDLTKSAEDHATSRSTDVPRLARLFISAEETAALLEVTEDLLRCWRAIGRGPQPVLTPKGRLDVSAQIEHLAAMPRLRRMLAVGRSMCWYISPRS